MEENNNQQASILADLDALNNNEIPGVSYDQPSVIEESITSEVNVEVPSYQENIMNEVTAEIPVVEENTMEPEVSVEIPSYNTEPVVEEPVVETSVEDTTMEPEVNVEVPSYDTEPVVEEPVINSADFNLEAPYNSDEQTQILPTIESTSTEGTSYLESSMNIQEPNATMQDEYVEPEIAPNLLANDYVDAPVKSYSQPIIYTNVNKQQNKPATPEENKNFMTSIILIIMLIIAIIGVVMFFSTGLI